jgi:predicted nucleic acid-binding protein
MTETVFVDTAGWMMLAKAADPRRRWFFKWRDKQFSFTDCTNFVVMKERRLRRALTSDRHFIQAGFEAVP